MIQGVRIRILTEHGSQSTFHRWVHILDYNGYQKRNPKHLEVANWPIRESERKELIYV